MRVTCIQMQAKVNDKRGNLQKMKGLGVKAMEIHPDTDLIVFPELALTGYECSATEAESMAEAIDGPSITEMAEFAAEKDVHIIFGFIEKSEFGNLHISAVLIDNNGRTLGSHKKMHMVESETVIFKPGDAYQVFDTSFGKVGIMICWDAAFPETARILALQGADLIAVPSAWEAPMQGDWDLIQKARAFDNVIYTACVNQVGKDRTLEFFGRSKIHGPLGEVLSDVVDDKEAIISASIDLSDKEDLRNNYYPLLRDRRPETYGALTKLYKH